MEMIQLAGELSFFFFISKKMKSEKTLAEVFKAEYQEDPYKRRR